MPAREGRLPRLEEGFLLWEQLQVLSQSGVVARVRTGKSSNLAVLRHVLDLSDDRGRNEVIDSDLGEVGLVREVVSGVRDELGVQASSCGAAGDVLFEEHLYHVLVTFGLRDSDSEDDHGNFLWQGLRQGAEADGGSVGPRMSLPGQTNNPRGERSSHYSERVNPDVKYWRQSQVLAMNGKMNGGGRGGMVESEPPDERSEEGDLFWVKRCANIEDPAVQCIRIPAASSRPSERHS